MTEAENRVATLTNGTAESYARVTGMLPYLVELVSSHHKPLRGELPK